jgi:hypothetical protein
VTTLATHVDGGPWGLVRDGGGLVAGVDYACPGAPTECVSGPSLVRSDGQILATLDELWDAHSLAAIDGRIYALSSGLMNGSTGCGGIGQLLEVTAGAHLRIGGVESDPRRAVRALGGIAYTVSNAQATVEPCSIGDVANASRSIRVFDGLDSKLISLDTMWVGTLGGTDDALFASRGNADNTTDVLSIGKDGGITTVGTIEPDLTPLAAAAAGDRLAVALLQIETTSDPDRCGSNPTPCLVAGETYVRMLGGSVGDVAVAQRGEVLLDLQSAGGRVFAGTSAALVEVPAGLED